MGKKFIIDLRKFQSPRNGLAVIDLIVAISILSVVLGVAGKLSLTMARQRIAFEQRRISSEATANLMSIAMSIPFEEVSVARLEQCSTEVLDADWQIVVSGGAVDGDDPQAAAPKEISLGCQWKSQSVGSPYRTLRAWRFPANDARRYVMEGGNDD